MRGVQRQFHVLGVDGSTSLIGLAVAGLRLTWWLSPWAQATYRR